MTTATDQTDCSSNNNHRQGHATTTNCHNSPVARGCNGGGNSGHVGAVTVGDQHYQVHRRMRQKLVEQQRVARSGAVKENLNKAEQVEAVVTEELVRLEVSLSSKCGGRKPNILQRFKNKIRSSRHLNSEVKGDDTL